MSRFSLVFKVILAFSALFGLLLIAGAHRNHTLAQSSEREKSAWVTALIAERTKGVDKTDTSPKFSMWFATNYMSASSFSQKFFPESGVDLNAKSADGKALWSKRSMSLTWNRPSAPPPPPRTEFYTCKLSLNFTL
ncbi:MAG: hypothetical protein NT018_11570 [Armatimonadetes bacterium]|nr:hypothetical protein [Armatimonadota bacterium]